jgi:hypothetical protein
LPPIAAQAGIDKNFLRVLATVCLTTVSAFTGIFASLALLHWRLGLVPRPYMLRRLRAWTQRTQSFDTRCFLYFIRVIGDVKRWWRIDGKAHIGQFSVT